MSNEPVPDTGFFDAAAADSIRWAKELEQLRIANNTKLVELRSSGADLEPLSVFMRRLAVLIDCLLPEHTDQRNLFEIRYERQISDVLDEAASAVRKAVLTSSLQHGELNNRQVLNKLVLPPGDVLG
jgi:hypothetical protein